MKIGNRLICEGEKAFIIVEIGQAHEGSLGFAHSFIDAVADSGADAIKFQTHIANAESTLDESFRIKMSGQDATRWNYWKRMEFSEEEWAGLARHASKRDLVFLSSPFSVAAVDLLAKIGMPAWKIGSGEVFNDQLIASISSKGGPILMSTGLSSYKEIEAGVKIVKKFKLELSLFQCTSMYPTPLEKIGINVLHELKQKFRCPVGLSDHSGSIYPSVFALAQGAEMIEVHGTFDKKMYGPDVSSSLTFAEINQIVKTNNAFDIIRKNPVNKDLIAKELEQTRNIFTKSLALNIDLEAGSKLSIENLTVKKPGTGIHPENLPKLIGRKLSKTVSSNRLLKWDDIE